MLKDCLTKLANAIDNRNDIEIIIFDNASNDETIDVIEQFIIENSDLDIRKIFNKKNIGLNAYKKLFSMAKGEYIVEVDDDVIDFPKSIDSIFDIYFNNFNNFGYLALDVIQNEYTGGAKRSEDNYQDVSKGELVVQQGPVGGYCSGFRRKDYKKIAWLFNFFGAYSFKKGEDAFLMKLFFLLGKKSGVIKGVKCFHAVGPYYSKMYGLLDRDIEKYERSGLTGHAEKYKMFL